MKYFIALYACVCIFFSSSNGQSAKVPQKVNTWYEFWGVTHDSVMGFPKVITQPRYRDTGVAYYRALDSSIYWWTGTQFRTFTGGGTTPPAAPNTSVQFNNTGVFGGSASMTWDNTLKAFSADSVRTYYADIKNITGQALKIRFHTKQGDSLPTGPYGNFWEAIDQSFYNTDGQIDATKSWGYNWDGQGKVNPAEAAWGTTIESHYIPFPGAPPQMEYYHSVFAENGNKERVFAYNSNKVNGATVMRFSFDSSSWQTNTAGTPSNYQWMQLGPHGMQLFGVASPVLQLTSNLPTNSGTFVVAPIDNSSGVVQISNASTDALASFNFQNNLAISPADTRLFNNIANFQIQAPGRVDSTTFLIDARSLAIDPNNAVFSVGHNGHTRMLATASIGSFQQSNPVSVALDITATDRGTRINPMTTNQKNAIASPVQGIQVYDRDVNSPAWYDGAQWNDRRGIHVINSIATSANLNLFANLYTVVNASAPIPLVNFLINPTPSNNDYIEIKFTNTITSITFSSGTFAVPLTSAVAGTYYKAVYDQATNTYY